MNIFAKKTLGSRRLLGAVALAAMTACLAPKAALADTLRFQGSFAVAYSATPNARAVSYCGGPSLPIAVEAHGNGFTSLGALAFTLFKTLGDGPLHGCLTFTTPDGDILEATYVGATVAGNPNNFAPATGALTFTGGTGRFSTARGRATWTAVFDNFYAASSFAGGGPAVPLQGMAFYVIDGKIRRGANH
jgi:hypothetical protein